ncbi:cation:proton antiporter [candidate division WOR-3 bacterium]|nr:cation:proton antiporter [candidate division WOR-3 bacterium]
MQSRQGRGDRAQLNSIFGIALIIIAAYAGAKLLRRVHFPAVTAYLLAGILIGPRLLNFIPPNLMAASDFISNLVLGIIAFSLGANFKIEQLRTGGKPVLWISVLEAGCAWLVVTIVMVVYHLLSDLPVHPAFVLGAAAAATAPAATVMVIREYRASGPVTEMLLRVVAIDDAWCLIFAALAIAAANAMSMGVFNVRVLFGAFAEIFAALILGGVLGIVLYAAARFIRTVEEVLVVTVGSILLAVGLAMQLHLSPLLTNIAFGFIVANVVKDSDVFFVNLRKIDMVLFLGFFVLVGANLEIGLLPKVGVMGVLYIVFRVIGKFAGVRLGAYISRADAKVGRYLGWGLVPQAGVALGVALSAKTLYPTYGGIIFTTITATTVIYELIGPIAAKYGLRKAGEI